MQCLIFYLHNAQMCFIIALPFDLYKPQNIGEHLSYTKKYFKQEVQLQWTPGI